MTDECRWFAALDALRVECDGMTRVIAALLQRDGISHTCMVGRLDVDAVGSITRHHWIELAGGRRIDLRARMWLRNDPRVPHGIVMAEAAGVRYEGRANRVPTDPQVFWAPTDTTCRRF